MSNLFNGSGGFKRLASVLTATKGRVTAVAVTLALIAGAGAGFASLRGSAPPKSAADSAPTATVPGGATATLGPTLGATATPAPGATPPPTTGPGASPTLWAGPPPVTQPTPSPTVASTPQLSVNPVMYIQEPNGCVAQYPDYFDNGFTVVNDGGGTLTWSVSDSSYTLAKSGIQLTAMGGSLAAGQSQYVQMYWVSGGPGPGAIPPRGGFPFTITSNAGDNPMAINCA